MVAALKRPDDFERQMQAAREVMDQYRAALQKLAETGTSP